MTALTHARSFLFVPANRPERYGKALASGADAIIIDLEDAVSPQGKDAAREALQQNFAALDAGVRARVLVRVNGEGTPWFARDAALMQILYTQGLGGLVIPKSEGVRVFNDLAARCPGAPLVPLIESGAGLDALEEVARAPGVVRLCLGHLDLQNDLGIACSEDEHEIASARWELVRTSRRAGLAAPIDGVTTDTRNPESTSRDVANSKRWGFTGKLCIHPAQVSLVHAAFVPGKDDVDWALRVLAAADKSSDSVTVVDGRMVDAPVIAKARRIVSRASD